MEVISTTTPVSSITVPSNIHHHRLYHLKPPLLLLPHPHGHLSTTTTTAAAAGKTPTSVSTKTTSSYRRHNFTPTQLPSTSKTTPSPPNYTLQTHHRNAATGYAAALIDAALCGNCLDAVHKDVERLLNWLQCNNGMLKGMMRDASVEESVKGGVIKDLLVLSKKKLGNKFQRQVVALLKMLVANNKSGMVPQVMEEFHRIYHRLNNTTQFAAA